MKITTTNFTDNLKVEKSSYNFVSLKKAEKKTQFYFRKVAIFLQNSFGKFD